MSAPTAAVIIPAYNAAATLPACLAGLACQQLPPGCTLDIIVVDDGSTDGTAAVAEGVPGVRLIRQAHQGAAAARNAGLAATGAPLVLFTDADCVPTPRWAAHLIAALDGPVVGVKGAYRTRQRERVARFVQVEYQDKYDRMARLPHIDFIDTYAAGYRRAVITGLGGFNPALHYIEDQELSYRVAAAGGRMRFVPEAVVYHRHAATLAAYARKKFHIGHWKVRVHTHQPQALARDSHTPTSQKVQMLLALLLVGTGVASGLVQVGSRLYPPLGRVRGVFAALTGLGGLAFLATVAPFTWKALRRDPAVGLIAPGMLAVRALALGAGFSRGLLGHGGPLIASLLRHATHPRRART